MMNSKRLFLSLTLFAFLTRLGAQESPPQKDSLSIATPTETPAKPRRYINFGYGIGISTMLNRLASANSYVGGSVPIVLGYESYNEAKKKIFRYQMKAESIGFYERFSIAQLLPKSFSGFAGLGQPLNEFSYVDINVDRLHFLRKIKKNDNLKVYVGTQAAGTFLMGSYQNSSYSNSATSLYAFLDLAAKGELNYEFSKKKRWNLNYSLSIPIIAVFIAPPYDNMIGVSGFNPGVTFIGKYTRLNSMVTVGYKLSNKNTLSLTYRWQYLNNSLSHDVQRFQMTNDYLIFKLSYAL